MKENDLKRLLDRYLRGECTPEEERQLEAGFDRLAAEGDTEVYERDRKLHSIKQKIDRQIRQEGWIRFPVIMKMAAAVMLVSFALAFCYYKRAYFIHGSAAIQYAVVVAPKGERKKLTLSDGSTVILNAGSTLRYRVKFDRHTREVTLLDGEAFFDIQPNDKVPFVVATTGTHTRVLGTAFNVQAYQSFEAVKVTVIRGSVAVNGASGQTPVVLLPDEQVTVNTTTGQQAKNHVNADESISWVQGRFQFRNETLANVALILQNRFNVKIGFKTPGSREIRFTANFEATDSLDKILFAIAKANGLTYSIKNNVVLF